jgi:hypothetical protein
MHSVYQDALRHPLDSGKILCRISLAAEKLFYPKPLGMAVNVIADGAIHENTSLMMSVKQV